MNETRSTERVTGLLGLAVSNTLWQALAFLGGRLLTTVATVVVARLLGPRDFGVVAIALFFVVFAEALSALGVGEALVYLPKARRTTDAALVLSVVTGVVFTIAGCAAAPAAAGFFQRPEVVDLCRLSTVGLLVVAAGQVPDALLRKELAFRRRLIPELLRALVQGLSSIGLATAGLGPWALVWGYIAGNLAWTTASWILVDYRPRLGSLMTRPAFRDLLSYGLPASGQALLVALLVDIDYVIVGRVLGAEELGQYTVAFRLPQIVVLNVFGVLSMVAFPIISRIRDEPDRLRRGYLATIRLQSTYGLAVSAGIVVMGPLLVRVVFGTDWVSASRAVAGLGLYAAFRSAGSGAADVYKGTGRPGIAALVTLVRLAVLVPVLILVAPFGIAAVAWAQAGTALAFAVLMQAVACRLLGVAPRALLAALRPGVVVALAVAIGALGGRLVPGTDVVRLVAGVLGGMVVGAACLCVTHGAHLLQLAAIVARRTRQAT